MRTIVCLCLMVFSCTHIEKEINKKLITNLKRDALLDQGYIYFDSIGNIRVEFNNLEFATNPLYTEASYIGVWVYAQNGDPLKNCCTGSVKECGELTKSCIKGVGFSNDLGFLGDRYLFIEPPRPFNKYADKYYMDVKVSDAAGVPRDYQGEYQPFSGPTNPVGDREIFDLYLGVFYSVFRPDGGFRAINSSASIGSRTIYTRVDPDFLSPRIRIESRFFSQTPQDPVGSMYVIPHLSTWKKLEPLDRELDKRKYLKINEIGNSIGKVTANDYIELYNPTEYEIFLDDVYLFRYTSERCSTLKEYSDRDDLSGLTIKPKGFLLLARSGSTLNPDYVLKNVIVGETDCFALATGGKPLDPTEESEDNPSADYKSFYKPRPALNPEPRIIDFVGTIDPDNKNYYLGSGPAPLIAYNAAISRCLDGVDTRNNENDFYIETSTPGTNNNCSFARPISKVQAGELVISEISVRNNTGGCVDTDDDYIEIYNTLDVPVNLAGARLYYITSGGLVSTSYTFESYILPAKSYVAVISKDSGCYNSSTVSNALFRGGSGFNLSSKSASIVLARNNFSFPSPQNGPDVVAGSTYILDYVGYGGEAKVYKTLPSNVIDNYSISYCTTSPANNNSLDYSLEPNTPGQANSCSGAVQVASLTKGEILISEISPSPTTPCTNGIDDFVEFYNPTSKRIQMGGAKLFYITSTPSVSTSIYYKFGNTIIEPYSYMVVISNTGGCFSSPLYSNRNIVFANGNLNLSGSGATVALGRNDNNLGSQPNGGPINEGSNYIIDYVGYYSNSKVYKTSPVSISCGNQSIKRTNPAIDTNNNQADFSICGILNGDPAVSN